MSTAIQADYVANLLASAIRHLVVHPGEIADHGALADTVSRFASRLMLGEQERAKETAVKIEEMIGWSQP